MELLEHQEQQGGQVMTEQQEIQEQQEVQDLTEILIMDRLGHQVLVVEQELLGLTVLVVDLLAIIYITVHQSL